MEFRGGIMASNFIILADDYQALEEKLLEIKTNYNLSEPINYDLSEEGVFALVDELMTVSLFGDVKFIVAKGSNELINKETSGFNELLKVMNDQNSSNVLVLTFTENVDFNNPHFESLKRFSALFDVRNKNINLEEYATKQFAKDGFKIADNVLKLLVSYSDGLANLKQFIDQLECYKEDTKEILNEDVLSLIVPPLDDNVYTLIDAVLANDKKQMLKVYQDLKLRSVTASYLVSLIITKFQEIYNVNILVKKGYNQAKVSELLNVSSGRAYYMVKNAKGYNIDDVKKHLDLLNELDYNIKTGKIDQNLGLELYFLN